MPKTKRAKYSARTSDKMELYEKSVQNVEREAPYIDRLVRRLRGKRAHTLREDFCGTAGLCCEWVKCSPDHHALGIDLHQPTLDWGQEHNLARLTDDQQKRVTLKKANVLDITTPKVDVVVAFNFSYYIFKTRDMLRRYFLTVHRSLKHDGIFILDAFGGSESLEETVERRKCGGFTYVWEHASFNPITSEILCHIHFEFPDGTRMKKAFTYDWRLWTLMEMQEILTEAGFENLEVHWENTDRETGEGNGVFRKTTRGEAIASWVAYVIARR